MWTVKVKVNMMLWCGSYEQMGKNMQWNAKQKLVREKRGRLGQTVTRKRNTHDSTMEKSTVGDRRGRRGRR